MLGRELKFRFLAVKAKARRISWGPGADASARASKRLPPSQLVDAIQKLT